MSRANFLTIVLGFAVLFAPAHSAEAKGKKATEAVPGEDGCHKKIGMQGRPHKLNTLASLSAVREWSQAAAKHGETFSMWHNAGGSSVKCKKLPRSDYYSCFASGKPCPAKEIPNAALGN